MKDLNSVHDETKRLMLMLTVSCCGWCRQSTTAPPPSLSPLPLPHPSTSIAAPSRLHGRPSRLFWFWFFWLLGQSRSTDLLSPPPLSPLADDEAHVYHHGDASSTSPSPSASLRPKSHIDQEQEHRNGKGPYTPLDRAYSHYTSPLSQN